MAPLTDLTKGFKAILKRAGTPQEFEDWLTEGDEVMAPYGPVPVGSG